MGDQVSLSCFHRDIGIPINFQEESSLVSFWSLELHGSLEVSRDVRPPVQMRRGTRFSSRISTQDSDIPLFCPMKHEPKFKPLHWNQAFFWVRPLVILYTWERKHRAPLSYLLLRENATWGSCENLAHLFSQRQGISSHLGTIWGAWRFPRVAVLILIFLSTWDGYLRESLSIPQGSQATCTVCCGTRDS